MQTLLKVALCSCKTKQKQKGVQGMFLIPAEEISGVSTSPAVCSILPLLGPTTGSDVAAAAEEQLHALCMGHKAEPREEGFEQQYGHVVDLALSQGLSELGLLVQLPAFWLSPHLCPLGSMKWMGGNTENIS